MGGREVGGLANMLANHLDIESEPHRDRVRQFWDSPTICTKAGLKAVDLFDACAAGKIKALWVMSTNPAVSMPDANAVAKAIETVPFVVVSDIMARTDTGDLADVLLPAAGWAEKDGTVTNSERRISRQRAFLPPPADTRPDWKIICDVAARMGWGAAFAYDTPAEIFAEYVALSDATRDLGRDLDLQGFSGVDYDNLQPTQWPKNNARFFADGQFYHADGKARMVAIEVPAMETAGGFVLNTGRNRDQWHTMTRTGKSRRLGTHLAEPYVEIHPQDSADMGVSDSDLVSVQGASGGAILRALITDRVVVGQLFAPMHWTRRRSVGGLVNALIVPGVDPVSGQPALKSSRVSAQKFDAAWYGFAAAERRLRLTDDYAAMSRTATGWQGEFASATAPQNWEGIAENVFGCASCEMVQSFDARTQTVRFALYDGARLTGVFFVSPTPVRLSRPYVVSLIGTEASPLIAMAGRSGAGQPDPGRTICACMEVGINTVRHAIAAGMDSVEAVGTATCAGTSCGSCKPEIAALLGQLPARMAAQ